MPGKSKIDTAEVLYHVAGCEIARQKTGPPREDSYDFLEPLGLKQLAISIAVGRGEALARHRTHTLATQM
jgi:hypothetical protein